MSLTGTVFSVTIKSDQESTEIRKFADVTLELNKTGSNPKVTITIPLDDEPVCEFRLNDCTYLDVSSSPGVVECIRINSEQITLIIIDKHKRCVKLLDYMRDYLTGKMSSQPKASYKPTASSKSKPQSSDDDDIPDKVDVSAKEDVHNEKVNQLIRALNSNDAQKASQVARQLAGEQISVRFALDLIDESGNAAPRQPPQPVVEPLKLKLSIESFLIGNCTDEQYDVFIIPQTTIKDLKQIVTRDTGINANQQYWYINREHLADNYIFGVTPPRVNENTILILFIAKPQND